MVSADRNGRGSSSKKSAPEETVSLPQPPIACPYVKSPEERKKARKEAFSIISGLVPPSRESLKGRDTDYLYSHEVTTVLTSSAISTSTAVCHHYTFVSALSSFNIDIAFLQLFYKTLFM